MKLNLLATKFHQPSLPPRRVQRPHLLQRLNEGLAAGGQLTLVSAPAGFGKTTCVSEWVTSLDRPAAWLSLDPLDDDPGRFFLYLIAALQSVDKDLGRDVESVLRAGQMPPIDSMVTALANDILGTARPFLLILDDFQLIQEKAILDFLARLISAQPQPMHLVLVTREDPLLPLARLRANNQLTEIRASDLRFAGFEVEGFLNGMMGLSLSEANLRALEDRTEGWVVGLQLAGLSMRDRADASNFIASLSGSHRFILSYLTEEVLGRQPEDVQIFLLQTSILNTLSGELCDAVTGRTDSREVLERLMKANLFLIPLDDDQQWYRYHHLFADLLRNQQGRILSDSVTGLHRRASRWYEQAGMAGEAIEHALAAADYPRAVQLLESHAPRLVNQGYIKTVEGWMQAIPSEWHLQSPKANLAFAWMHLLRGSYAKIPPYLKQVEAAISNAELAAGDVAALQAEWFALQASLLHVQGKAAESVEMANRALELAPAEDFNVRGLAYFWLGGAFRETGDYTRSVEAYQQAIHNSRAGENLVTEILAVAQLALMAIENGKLHFAIEVCSRAVGRMEQGGVTPPPIGGAIYGALGLVCYEWNLLEKARQYFLRGVALSAFSGHNAALIFNKILLARLDLVEGSLQDAAKAIQEAVDLLQLGAPAWIKPEVAAQQVRVYLAQNNPDAAEAVLHQYGISLPDEPARKEIPYSQELLYLALLRLVFYFIHREMAPHLETAAQESRGGQAHLGQVGIDLANRLIAGATAGQRLGIALKALILRSLIHAARGNIAASLDDLDQALALAEPEGDIRVFVDEGAEMAALLARSLERAGRPLQGKTGFIEQVLAAFSAQQIESQALGRASRTESLIPEPSRNLLPDLAEPLTDRELEVLRLIAQGLKYEEIAGQLIITLNTVRFYVKEIYSKLNVNNRTKAVAAARQLGLL